MEVTDGIDGALAVGIAVAATMQLFVRTPEISHAVGTTRAHVVLNISPQENAHLLAKQKRAGPRGGVELVDLAWVCLQLNSCCDSQSSCSYNRLFPWRPRFPVKHSVLCKYDIYYVVITNRSTEVREQSILFPFVLCRKEQ